MTFQPRTIEYLDRQIADANEKIEEWAGTFKVNPMYALEWAERIAETVAEREILMIIHQFATKIPDTTREELMTYLTENVMHRAMQECSSTSHFSNATNMVKMNVCRRMIAGAFNSLGGYFVKEGGE